MIKGLVITPPVVGRISIGQVVESNGRRLPQKDDQFTITSQIQNREGWILHPLDEQLRQQNESKKLRSIPVKLLFNEPELNLRAEYSMFDRKTGRPICVGDGETCRRATQEGVKQFDCPSPNLCEFGKGGLCKAYGRLNVAAGNEDDLSSFIFRTTGFNSIRTLMARMMYYNSVSGGLLSCMNFQLKLRGKSTTQSHRTPIFYVDLVLPEGISLEVAIQQAREVKQLRDAAGFDQAALDEAAKAGFANGQFEYTEDELPDILEEFYPATEINQPNPPPQQNNQLLRQKLAKAS